MSYNANTDYQALINAEKAKGTSANTSYLATLEQARNEKIAGTKSTYAPTYNYNAAPSSSSNSTGSTSATGSVSQTAQNINRTGSTGATGSVSPTAQNIINQMNANSLLWYTDPANRDNLHQQNVVLSNKLAALAETGEDGSITTYEPVYNPDAGTWTITPHYQSALQQTTLQQQNPTANSAVLSGLEFGDKYGLTYNMDSIKAILDAATQAQYALKNQQYAQTENQFYNQMNNTQATALDTLRQSQAAAVATGASKGMSAANELSSILNLQNTASTEANTLATGKQNLATEEAQAYKDNASTALTTSNTVKQAIAQLAETKYGYDTQGYAAQLSYLSALQDALAQKYGSDKTLEGVQYNADANVNAAQLAASKYGSTNYTYTGGNSSNPKSNPSSNPSSDPKSGTPNMPGSPKIGTNTAAGLGMTNTDKSDDGVWTYEEKYKDEMTEAVRARAIKMYNDIGYWPADITGKYDKKTGKYDISYINKSNTNKIVFDGKSGQKVEVGYGHYASVWTYDATKKVWVNGKSTMTNAQFKAYMQKQNPAHVKKIK